MKEKELKPIIADWLQNKNYYCIYELLLGGYCDVVACKWNERVGRKVPKLIDVIAVELKLDDVSGVIRQAVSNKYYVNESYAAMPKSRINKMREGTLNKFKQAGVGLLSVGDGVEEVVKPEINLFESFDKYLVKRVWSRKLRDVRRAKINVKT